MPVNLPSVAAGATHRTVTLGELRDLVAAATGLPDDLIVRGKAIPFYVPDLGHQLGGRLTNLALDAPSPLVEPNRAQRRAGKGGRGA